MMMRKESNAAQRCFSAVHFLVSCYGEASNVCGSDSLNFELMKLVVDYAKEILRV